MVTRRGVVFAGLTVALIASACTGGPRTVEVAGVSEQALPVREVPRPPTTSPPPDAVAVPVKAQPLTALVRNDDGRAPISIGFAGDTSFHNGLHLHSPLAEVATFLRLPDFMVLNLETAVAAPSIGTAPVNKQFLFRSDPAMVDQLVDAGIDAVSMANNHALDFGGDALIHGLALLEDAGIQTVGGGPDAEAAYKPLIQTVGDWTIGIAAFSRVPCDWSWAGQNVRPQVAWACPAFMEEADAVVSALVDDVDLAIVMVHGGTEGQLCPDQTMTDLNQHWSNMGVGLVVNSHPHVVQGVTSIDETLVINSTGNFAFPPSLGLTANSAVFIATLSDHGVFLSVEPFVSEGGIVRSGSAVRRQSIRDQIDRYSDGWRVLDDGRLIQETGWTGLCRVAP